MIKISDWIGKYELNDKNQTAKLYHSECFCTIPRTVKFNSKEYLVTGINENSLHNDLMFNEHFVRFKNDVQILSIEKNTFINSPYIKFLEIPPSLKELKEGWCNGIKWLNHISISPNNKNFKLINNNMIASKSNQKNDVFDVLAYGYRNIEQIKIPSYIKRISQYCFSNCYQIKTIELSENSELYSIGTNAFACSSIKHLHIPSKLIELEDGWCERTPNLVNVSISSENKCFKLIDKKMIVGKSSSDESNETFDDLKFACRDIGDVIIPSYIKYISSNCFEECKKLEKVKFNDNSNIKTIEKRAFYKSSLKSLYIPTNLKELKDGWCAGTSNLVNISISSENKYFKIIENKMIVGKSNLDENNKIFDVLIFVCRDIEKIKIPSYIKHISPYCFEKCKCLQKVEFEKNSQLISIGNFAFSKSSIENITIPKNCKEIGECAFFCCNLLNVIEFHENSKLQLIGDKSFSKTSIKSIKIPKYVKKIGKESFSNCKLLINVTFSEESELDIIGEQAFQESSLISISIPSHVNQIGRKAFYRCKCLKNVEFEPNSKIISIEDYSFYDTSISSICIPSKIKFIQFCAFCECKKLRSVKFNEDSELVFIGESAFSYTSLEKFVVPSHLKSIDSNSFYSKVKCKFEFGKNSELNSITSLLVDENENSLIIPKNAHIFTGLSSDAFNKVFHVSISPENTHLKLIDEKMIVGKSDNDTFDVLLFACRDIKIAKIPSYIKYISSYCFNKCQELKSLNFPSDSELISIDESAFSDSSIESITIPIHVKKIGKDAFKYCSKLKTIQILENSELESIEENAFQGSSIKSIYIPKNINVRSFELFCQYLNEISLSPENKNLKIINEKIVVGKSEPNMKKFDTLVFAFREIEDIIVPNYIRYIAPYCFYNCQNLHKIEFEPNSELISIGHNSFAKSSIENISIPIHVKKIESNAFSETQKLKTVTFPDNSEIEIIEQKAFECSSISSIKYPDNITKIEEYTFYECNKLNTVEFSPKSKLITIQENAFSMSSITKICIPVHVKTIKFSAFSDCNELETVLFEDNSELTEIGQRAFDCTKIEKIIIPSHVKIIANHAFNSCQNLKSVIFSPNSELEIIEKYAFNETSLKKIVIPKNVIKIEEGSFANNNELVNLEFDENSQLIFFNLGAPFNTNININIPSNVQFLYSDFLYNYKQLEKITISPKNKHFVSLDNQMIVENSGDKLDTLKCACSKITKAKIPSYIKHISQYCFEMIENLETIEFSQNSELETIGKGAFMSTSIKNITIPAGVEYIKELFHGCRKLKTVNFAPNSELKAIGKFSFQASSIENISIPKKLRELKDGWCAGTPNLVNISISSENKYFKIIENKMIVGKSNLDENNKIFDVLIFVCRDIEKIKIPSYIKHISPYCFENCQKLKSLTFSPNSKLIDIGAYAFSNSSIENISIPKSCKRIDKFCFDGASKLTTIEFPENSELNFISNNTFSKSNLNGAIIPSGVYITEPESFCKCHNLKSICFLGDFVCLPSDSFKECNCLSIIEFQNSCNVEIYKDTFSNTDIRIYVIPITKIRFI